MNKTTDRAKKINKIVILVNLGKKVQFKFVLLF